MGHIIWLINSENRRLNTLGLSFWQINWRLLNPADVIANNQIGLSCDLDQGLTD